MVSQTAIAMSGSYIRERDTAHRASDAPSRYDATLHLVSDNGTCTAGFRGCGTEEYHTTRVLDRCISRT